MVPHLVTALSGPLRDLERRILDSTPQIERWFRLEWQEHTPPFHASVNLRNAGFKLAPVDTSLFPAGFHHLSNDVLPLAVQAAVAAIEKYCPDARSLLLIPQDHTRTHVCRLQHEARLAKVLRQTGLSVRFGSLSPEVVTPTRVDLPDGQSLLLEPLERVGRRVGLKHFDPCSILLNDDLSAGVPDILQNLHEQVLLPPLHAGWAVRRKSNHLRACHDVAKKFAKALDIDPWLLNPLHLRVSGVDFNDRSGEESLMGGVDALLRQIRSKYKEYGIKDKPFLIVKADAGSCGRGVVSVRDAAELRNLDARQRSRMAVVKAGVELHDVILQEGVPTLETMRDGPAEPVVYLIDRFVVGGFYRVNSERGRDENLHAPGMEFVPLPFAASCNMPDASASPGHAANRFYSYGVVARLAVLAASVELERTDPDQSLYG